MKYSQNYPNTRWCENYHKHTHYHIDYKAVLMVGVLLIGFVVLADLALRSSGNQGDYCSAKYATKYMTTKQIGKVLIDLEDIYQDLSKDKVKSAMDEISKVYDILMADYELRSNTTRKGNK